MSARGYFGALAKARKFWAAENARHAASAIEAATAGETPQSGSTEGESAVGESRDAQTQSRGEANV